MSKKIPFSKLRRTSIACPSQWEFIDNGFGVYIRYRHNQLTVYINENCNNDIFDCIDEKYLVLYIKRLSHDPKDYDCGDLNETDLFRILNSHNLLEDTDEDRFL